VEVVASLSQGRAAAAQCSLFTHKSVPVIFEPPCINGIKLKYLEKTCSYATLSTTNPVWTVLGFDSGLCSKRSVPNHLSPSIPNSAYRCFLLITSSVFSILLKHTMAHNEVYRDMLRLFKWDFSVCVGDLHYYIIGTTTFWMDHTLNINDLNLAESVYHQILF